MKTCIACSMPLENPADIGAMTPDGSVCIHCVNSEGQMKSCEEIFEGGVQFFLSAVPGTNRILAEKLVRKNMNALLFWKKNHHPCLDGEQATNEEFSEALKSL